MAVDPYAPEVCEERRRRIRVALAAWAYERYARPIMDDATFDRLCREIDPSIETGRPQLDRFFKTKFAAHTGQWIYQHPELHIVDAHVRRIIGDKD